MAFKLEDVMTDNFKYGYTMEDLFKMVENKKHEKLNVSDIKHWVYKPCWSYKCGEK